MAAAIGLEDRGGLRTADYYRGSRFGFELFVDSSGRYHFKDRSGADRMAGYNYRTCS